MGSGAKPQPKNDFYIFRGQRNALIFNVISKYYRSIGLFVKSAFFGEWELVDKDPKILVLYCLT